MMIFSRRFMLVAFVALNLVLFAAAQNDADVKSDQPDASSGSQDKASDGTNSGHDDQADHGDHNDQGDQADHGDHNDHNDQGDHGDHNDHSDPNGQPAPEQPGEAGSGAADFMPTQYLSIVPFVLLFLKQIFN